MLIENIGYSLVQLDRNLFIFSLEACMDSSFFDELLPVSSMMLEQVTPNGEVQYRIRQTCVVLQLSPEPTKVIFKHGHPFNIFSQSSPMCIISTTVQRTKIA
jgi:hypothetical protein